MENYTGVSVLYVGSSVIDKLHKGKKGIKASYLQEEKFNPNDCLVIKSSENQQQSVLARVMPDGETVIKIITPYKIFGIESRNKEQAMLMSQLADPNVALNIVTGLAGSGKTICALAAALELLIEQKRYKKLILTKPMDIVGRISLGAVPGDIKEKFQPYTINFQTNMEQLLADHSRMYLSGMEDKSIIQYVPIQLMRGASFKDSIIIADEVQVLDAHEMKTICTRIGENSKLMIMGDLTQRDRNIKIDDTGIFKLFNNEKIQKSHLCSCIELRKCERSELAQLMTEVL